MIPAAEGGTGRRPRKVVPDAGRGDGGRRTDGGGATVTSGETWPLALRNCAINHPDTL